MPTQPTVANGLFMRFINATIGCGTKARRAAYGHKLAIKSVTVRGLTVVVKSRLFIA